MDKFNFNADAPLSDGEFDRLDAFLQSDRVPEGTLEVDELDGLFAALICGPRVVAPSEWLPVVWNGERPEWESMEEFQGIFELMMRHWNAIARAINSGEYEPLLRYGQDDAGEDVDDPAGWCYGFLEGAGMWGVEEWDDDELRSLITPMVALHDDGPDDGADDDFNAAIQEPGVRERLVDMLPDAVEELRAYWMEHGSPPSVDASATEDDTDDTPPAKHPAMKHPRRNDPCPCGSGKKYKHCCGAPA